MKYVKMLGFSAAGAVALMAFVGAGSASATVLTGSSGVLPAGTEIHAVNEGTSVTTDGFKNAECKKSTLSMQVTSAGSPTETVRGSVTGLTFEECNCTVVVVKKGTLELHTQNATANNNGTLTSSGLTETVQCNTIFGPVHCNFETVNTDLGTLTGSTTTGGTATMDITATVPVEEEGSNALCFEESVWHVKYTVTNPNPLDVD